ncbi:hypothetical protein ABZ958_37110 [Streptomyces sp. NPDC046237]|uniref:hypothetical protein n=1 Tax=Streptomyces sp. NPDC046237 TaxID=3154914 RepID=UPI0033C64CF5
MRVAHWTEPAGAFSETVIIVNRSLDPVSDVRMLFYAPDAGIDPAKHEWLSLGSDSFLRQLVLVLVLVLSRRRAESGRRGRGVVDGPVGDGRRAIGLVP